MPEMEIKKLLRKEVSISIEDEDTEDRYKVEEIGASKTTDWVLISFSLSVYLCWLLYVYDADIRGAPTAAVRNKACLFGAFTLPVAVAIVAGYYAMYTHYRFLRGCTLAALFCAAFVLIAAAFVVGPYHAFFILPFSGVIWVYYKVSS